MVISSWPFGRQEGKGKTAGVKLRISRQRKQTLAPSLEDDLHFTAFDINFMVIHLSASMRPIFPLFDSVNALRWSR